MASSDDRRSGLETISISATPERLRSTKLMFGVLVVDRFAGVLLEMQPLDADLDLALGAHVEQHFALADDGVLELGDLVALRQVGIEIVLAVEDRALVDLRLEPEAGAHRLAHAFLVDHRQHAGHRRIDEADIGIGRPAEFGRGAGEQLALRRHLRMDFHADDHLPIAGLALDEALGVGSARIDEGQVYSFDVVDGAAPGVEALFEPHAHLRFAAGLALALEGEDLVALVLVEVHRAHVVGERIELDAVGALELEQRFHAPQQQRTNAVILKLGRHEQERDIGAAA